MPARATGKGDQLVTTNTKECAKHRVFADLDRYVEFYERFARSVFGFCTSGTSAVCNIDSYVYSSIQGTLTSITSTLSYGRIGDSYALLRRFYDSAVINVYSNLYLQDHFSVENLVVDQINDWLQGKRPIPEYRIMSSYIRDSSKLKTLNDLLYADDRYRRIRKRCNALTHYNSFQHVLLNDGEIYVKNRTKWVDQFAEDARDIVVLHLAYVFFLNDHYLMSSDYVDCLECNMTPEPDSQYWVSPFIQEAFTDILVATRPEIAQTIKLKTSMHLL
jgi:hypothetical protein